VVAPVRAERARLARVLSVAWNAAAAALLALAVAQIATCIAFDASTAPQVAVDPAAPYPGLAWPASVLWAALALSVVNLSLLLLTAFKHTQLDPGSRRIWQALARAARVAGAVGLVGAVALAAMSVWAHLAWGAQLAVWSRFASAAQRLAGLAFGFAVDFAALRAVEPELEFVVAFFLVWFALVVVGVVFLVVGAVMDAYFEVAHAGVGRAPAGVDGGDDERALGRNVFARRLVRAPVDVLRAYRGDVVAWWHRWWARRTAASATAGARS